MLNFKFCNLNFVMFAATMFIFSCNFPKYVPAQNNILSYSMVWQT